VKREVLEQAKVNEEMVKAVITTGYGRDIIPDRQRV
jgi:activator of 2-hydroxyglutaryl-CoA dehydratase